MNPASMFLSEGALSENCVCLSAWKADGISQGLVKRDFIMSTGSSRLLFPAICTSPDSSSSSASNIWWSTSARSTCKHSAKTRELSNCIRVGWIVEYRWQTGSLWNRQKYRHSAFSNHTLITGSLLCSSSLNTEVRIAVFQHARKVNTGHGGLGQVQGMQPKGFEYRSWHRCCSSSWSIGCSSCRWLKRNSKSSASGDLAWSRAHTSMAV
mmetsp:Transcript_12665/g.24350  ORF Transcript_12665/g.24350 Transcript_12665/m.24350 type:complete len:210 (-) Transcript_12665:534-1163(-)